MKIPLVALIAMAGCLPATAQQNRVSIALGTLTNSKTTVHEDFLRTDRTVSYRYALPTIGYHRMLNAKTGIGLELGYGRGRATVKEVSPAWHPNVPTTQYIDERIETDEIYVSPNLFTLITTANRRFRFTPGISLPVGYMLRSSSVSTWFAMRDEDELSLGSTRAVGPEQKAFSVGLMLGGSALYRLGGNLYAGMQLGAGFRYLRTRTEGELVETWNEGQPDESRRTAVIKENSEGVNFQFQPAVVVNYFF